MVLAQFLPTLLPNSLIILLKWFGLAAWYFVTEMENRIVLNNQHREFPEVDIIFSKHFSGHINQRFKTS